MTIVRIARSTRCHPLLVAAASIAAAFQVASASAPARSTTFWSTPAIPGYGRIHPLPQAAYRPDPTQTYRVVFLITKDGGKPTRLNDGLAHVARAVNLYASAGVALDHLRFVAIITGPATMATLDDAHFRAKFGVANPNLDLIAKLRGAGVDVAVCGQALAGLGIADSSLAPGIRVALSALTAVTMLEHRGYGLVSM